LFKGCPQAIRESGRWWITVAQGMVGIAIGAIALVSPVDTRTTLGWLFAVWAVVIGILEISTAIRRRRSLPSVFVYSIGHGVLSVALGTLTAFFHIALGALLIYALVQGFWLMIRLGFRLRTS
jgi:uncharacterized membrane protein HdeD (DUF308 family)